MLNPRKAKLFPTLRYQDTEQAVRWLCDTFGFQCHFIAEDGGIVVHAQLRVGDDLIFIGPDRVDDPYGLHSPKALNGTNQCVCVAISEDIDRHCAQTRQMGGQIVAEPHDTPYGAREYSCRDPEGHIWCFGSYWGEPFDDKASPDTQNVS
jgi:uncharacterized glyoxalase superfamily protein PhnB